MPHLAVEKNVVPLITAFKQTWSLLRVALLHSDVQNGRRCLSSGMCSSHAFEAKKKKRQINLRGPAPSGEETDKNLDCYLLLPVSYVPE